MSANPAPFVKWRAFDANGDPLAGGKLYTYSAGTTTPLATYTTSAGTIANANPVVLDANGQADVWLAPGVDYKFVLKNSLNVVQWTEDNIPSPAEQDGTLDTGISVNGRLTLTSLTPVTTSDVTGATTIYFEPYGGNKVPLYDGSEWALREITASPSQTTGDNTKSPSAVAANKNYDMFLWNDAGTLRLSRGPAWTSDTSRGSGGGTTELESIDGRYVNTQSISNGPDANCGLYVGTVRSDASSQFNDSLTKRHVWNMYNRKIRPMLVAPGASWTYSTNVLRQANAAATNQLDVVVGISEDDARMGVQTHFSNSTSGTVGIVGIGMDSTTTHATGSIRTTNVNRDTIGGEAMVTASWRGFPGIGRHYFAWLENAISNTGTYTWNATSSFSNGAIFGEVLA